MLPGMLGVSLISASDPIFLWGPRNLQSFNNTGNEHTIVKKRYVMKPLEIKKYMHNALIGILSLGIIVVKKAFQSNIFWAP